MRPQLDRGRLIKPASVRAGRERDRALTSHIVRIEEQLADDSRRKLFSNETTYLAWRHSAANAKRLLGVEQTQLRAWLSTAEHPLFKEAYTLLKQLREDSVDFDPHELELMAKLDKHFG